MDVLQIAQQQIYQVLSYQDTWQEKFHYCSASSNAGIETNLQISKVRMNTCLIIVDNT